MKQGGTRMVEYVCVECGVRVFNAALETPPTPPRCATCEWIAQNVDPADYAAVRIALGVSE